MPQNIAKAVNFLETQWSSINENKIKGILAEVRLRAFLKQHGTHFGPGGWIVIPGRPTSGAPVPTRKKVCLIPRTQLFSWQPPAVQGGALTLAEVSAYNYFRQHQIQAYFIQPEPVQETAFKLPLSSKQAPKASYPRPYALELMQANANGQLEAVAPSVVFGSFPPRDGNKGLRCYATGRLNLSSKPWDDAGIVAELFWFEYARYYYQIDYMLSVNDLDMYIIGASGSAYPIELKSKSAAEDSSLGEWFGIDMGPFAKLAFFTANGMNTDGIYIVEELDSKGSFVGWLGIRYTELVRVCSWVGQGGGKSMTGGASSTYKVPKAAFTPLGALLNAL